MKFRAAQLSEEAAFFFCFSFLVLFGRSVERSEKPNPIQEIFCIAFPTNLAIKRTCAFSLQITVISYKSLHESK